ncbi:MAG TPA: Flp pilus assembly protein CpaB [Thermoleophilaceae bacterium]|nr:Flp pilus assembly protein CpaB [Thermoleophilaceae bacterium]
MSTRRRGLLLLSLALACGGLAASRVRNLEREVEARAGPSLPVLVAARDLEADSPVAPGALRVARVPARYVPPDALADVGDLAGARTATIVPRGSYLTASRLRSGARERRAGELRRGERAVELAVVGAATAPPGSRVDVLVSSEQGGVAGRTVLALERVELLAVRPGAATRAVATLRVTVRQAVYLTAAANFAREVRLLVRPPGDRGRAGAAAVGAAEL